jgi:preprotein translocase YajC subunit
MARPAEEMLYLAMEDFRVDVVVGKGPGATSIPLDIAPFTLVGATTRSGALTGPLRDRFGFTAHMEFYDPAELEYVLRRAATILGVDLRADGAAEIAARSRGTPRIANRLLRRVRDFAQVRADGSVTREVARAALAVYDVDELGLDRLDRAVLGALVRSFGGGPVGVSTLAVAVGEEPGTVEEVCEPYLVRAGMLARTPRGIWASLHRPTSPRADLPRCSEAGAGRLGWLSTCGDSETMDISLLFPLLILLLFIPIFLSGRRQRRQMQEMQRLQSSLEPGDVVMTTSGMRGTIVDASYEDTVDIEIADGVVTTWVRAAVREKINPTVEEHAAEPEKKDDSESSPSLEKDDSSNGTPRT